MFFYSDIDIQFHVGKCKFHAINMNFVAIKHNIPSHSHGINCYEIHFISDGYGTLHAEGSEYTITPNTLFVTGPLIAHSQLPDVSNPMQEWCIFLSTDSNENEKYDAIISEFLSKKFWIGQDKQQLLPLFQRLFAELENRPDGYRDMAKLLLSEILISVTRNYIQNPEQVGELSSTLSERTGIIIDEYFLYEYRTASLSELSQRLELSPRQTQRIIEKYYGSNFIEKKNEARMSAAVMLLADASLSLGDISERLGYSSQEYFSAAFKKHYNVSPGRYRKNIQK